MKTKVHIHGVCIRAGPCKLHYLKAQMLDEVIADYVPLSSKCNFSSKSLEKMYS